VGESAIVGSTSFRAAALAIIGVLAAGDALAASDRRLALPKDVKVPNDTVVAAYIPASELRARFYLSEARLWVQPGKALADALEQVGGRLFQQLDAFDDDADSAFGLLLDIDPSWSAERGQVRLQLDYKVFGADGTELRRGKQSHKLQFNRGGPGGGVPNVALRAMQAVMVDVLRVLKPNAATFPAAGSTRGFDREQLVDRAKPVSTGTGFFINHAGQLLTAAHVLRDCLLIEARQDERTFPVRLRAADDLLDLAVVDADAPAARALPLRAGQTLVLGEAVSNVGFPLHGILAASPHLTRGNVSARSGLKGSPGTFQFSAPIQPGASGGPVVSDAGELIGVAVGTLDPAALASRGVLPQNVNFALDARYAAMFLRRHGIEFDEVPAAAGGDMATANDAALAAVVQLSCYQ
jgi:serine protease Do